MVFETIKWETTYKTDNSRHIEVVMIFVDDSYLLGNNLWFLHLTKWRKKKKKLEAIILWLKNGDTFPFPVSMIKGDRFQMSKAESLITLTTDNLPIPTFLMFAFLRFVREKEQLRYKACRVC